MLSLTPLRSNIIVGKLEISPKTSRFPVTVSTPPTQKSKEADSKRVKNGAIYGTSRTPSTRSAIRLDVSQLLDAIKAPGNDRRRLRHLLLFSPRRLGVTRHSRPLIAAISCAASPRLVTISDERRRGARRETQRLKDQTFGAEPQPEKTPTRFEWLRDRLWSRLPVTGTVGEATPCSRSDVLI